MSARASSQTIFCPDRRKVVVAEDQSIYILYNAESLPPRPPGDRAIYEPSEAWFPQYASNRYPFLCMMPLAFDSRRHRTRHKLSSWLGSLGMSRSELPIIQRPDGGWQLEKEKIKAWEALEGELFQLCRVLTDDIGLPLDFGFFVFPFKLGYRRSHNTAVQARRAAQRSRDALVVFSATASYLIARHISQGQNWYNIVLDRTALLPFWLDNVARSEICKFSAERIGAFVDLSNCLWFKSMCYLIHYNVPFFIFWGKTEEYSPSNLDKTDLEYIARFRPTTEEVTAARHLVDPPLIIDPSSLTESTQGVWEVWNSTAWEQGDAPGWETSPLDAARQLAPQQQVYIEPHVVATFMLGQVERGSRQRPHESMGEFFERQAEERKARLTRETLRDKQVRESRRKNAERHTLPGAGGAKVFYWEEHGGLRYRRYVARKSVERLWELYAPSQMCYNDYRNEWDVCTEFDLDGIPPEDEWDTMTEDNLSQPPIPANQPPPLPDEYDTFEHEYIIARDTQTPPELQLDLDQLGADLKAVYGDFGLGTAEVVIAASHVNLKDMLYPRYGFLFNADSAAASEASQLPLDFPLNTEDWIQTRKILADQESPMALSAPYVQAIARFVTSIMHKDNPNDMMDIHLPLHAAVLRERVKAMRQNVDPFILKKWRLSDTTVYLLWPLNIINYAIMVNDPTLIVEVLRRNVTDLKDIVRLFAERGSLFKTLAILESPGRQLPLRLAGLGYRAAGYIPNAVDYEHYEQELRKFFRQPHARAALSCGGPLWRLAIEHISPQDSGFGPTLNVEHGQEFVVDGVQMWDDMLSDDEIDLVCGTYRIYTGQSDRYAVSSWWPIPRHWEKSGLNAGYWSPGCERWFQKRLLAIRNNEQSVKKAGEWKQAVRFSKQTRTLVLHNQELAAEFLGTVL